MRYCVLFPQAENVHLIKDVGMIPYMMHKLFGYDAHIACYNNDDYFYLDKEVKGLKLDFIKKFFNNDILDGVIYLKKNANKIDILQLFHTTARSVVYAFIYKLYNPKGKIFLKLDCTKELICKIRMLHGIRRILFNKFIDKIDIIGVEQEALYDDLRKILNTNGNKLINIPNGIDFVSRIAKDDSSYKYKENIILNVGRIGSPEKGSDILMEAFLEIPNIDNINWKLVFIGEICSNFKPYIEKYFKDNPNMLDKVIFKGAIYDREKLYQEYKNAKIFCLTSKYESFGIALLEAASYGDVIISTNVGIAKEITENSNGAIVDVDDINALSEKLNIFMNSDNLEDISNNTYKVCKEKYDWNIIVSRLYKRIKNMGGELN